MCLLVHACTGTETGAANRNRQSNKLTSRYTDWLTIKSLTGLYIMYNRADVYRWQVSIERQDVGLADRQVGKLFFRQRFYCQERRGKISLRVNRKEKESTPPPILLSSCRGHCHRGKEGTAVNAWGGGGLRKLLHRWRRFSEKLHTCQIRGLASFLPRGSISSRVDMLK
jgi:hypothetical protein